MPELPEVEVIRRYFDEAATEHKIAAVDYLDKLDKIYKSSRQVISQNLIGNRFTESRRIGKYMFGRISNGKWLFLHFGMTGSLELFNDDESQPKHCRMIIHFDDGSRLAFVDLRKFGRVEIIDDPEQFKDNHKLGTDLLRIKSSDFISALKGREIAIKTALLEQRHFAGIGNWIADEMLFRCGVHPEESCNRLSKSELEDLLKEAVRICERAIEVDTHYGSFPEDYFMRYRKKGARHPDHPSSPVEKLKVGGRGTFIVPEKQKLKG